MYVFIKRGLAPAAGSLWLRGLMETSFKKQIFVNLTCSFLSSSTCCSHRVYNTVQGLGPPWPLIGQGPRERLWCDGNDKNSSVRSPAAFWEHSPHLLTESMCAAGPLQGHREPSSAELITVHFKSSFVPGSLACFFLSFFFFPTLLHLRRHHYYSEVFHQVLAIRELQTVQITELI